MDDFDFPDMPDTLTPAQLVQYLPQSRRTIDRWIAEGTLPAYRLGGRVLLRKADVIALVRRVKVAS
jgi:excisionase family DNA binding protein